MNRRTILKRPVNEAGGTLLESAAELILKTGQREIDIKQLAKLTKVPRSSIYAQFAQGHDVKEAIFLQILNGFLAESATLIGSALTTIDPSVATPIERLTAVFRATLAAFKQNPLFGKVVLAHLDLQREDEIPLVLQIFEQVDQLISAARKEGQLAPEPAARLADWKIRHVIFVVARGLLRAMYLESGPSVDQRRSGQT